MKKREKKIFLTILMLTVLLGAFVQTGCGAQITKGDAAMEETSWIMMETSSSDADMSYMSNDMEYEVVEEYAAQTSIHATVVEEGQPAGGSANESAGQAQKLILNIYIDMTVENPSAAMDQIIAYAQNAGGYLLSSEDYYNVEKNTGGAYVIVRIPGGSSEKMEEYLKSVGQINNSRANADDVTGEYYDLQARIQQGELEVKTLEELLSQCSTVEEVLLVRDQLSRVQSDLEAMKGRMRVLKELTGYDTIEIHLSPVYSMVNVDDGDRFITGSEFADGLIKGLKNSFRGFVNGCANFVIFLSENILQLMLFGGVIAGVVLIIKRRVKKRRAKRAAAMQQTEQIPQQN